MNGWTAVQELLDAAVDHDVVPGAVAVVSDRHGLRQCAAGVRDTRSGAPMTVDTVFRIASMTKAITAVAVLQLVEQGLVGLDTPVGDVLPAFDRLPLLVGFAGDEPVLRSPRTRATVRQLLAHSAGLAYEAWHADLGRYHRVTGLPTVSTGLRRGFEAPLVAEPGTVFAYSTSVDWAGLVVEELAGEPLDRVYRTRILDPLGMRDTAVELSAEQRRRSAPVHVRDESGAWAPSEIDVPQQPEMYAGGHCLYSTAGDFMRFQSALLHDGRGPLGPLVAPGFVDEMLSGQLGEIPVEVFRSVDPASTADVDLGPGVTWGLGLYVTEHPEPGCRPAGAGGWAGLFNTFYWIDRSNGLAAALYTQTLPFYDSQVVDLWTGFERLVYATAA